MASHEQSYRAGETKGRTEEKTNQMMSNLGEKAQAAKDKTKETAQAANDKTQQTAQAAKVKTGAAKEKTSEMGQSTKESDNTGGFMQQTGDKVRDIAQGATEAVKQTLGLGQHDQDHDYYPTHHRTDY